MVREGDIDAKFGWAKIGEGSVGLRKRVRFELGLERA